MKIITRLAVVLLIFCVLAMCTSCFSNGNGSASSESIFVPDNNNGLENDNNISSESNFENNVGENSDEVIDTEGENTEVDNPSESENVISGTDKYPDDFEGDIVIGSQYFDGENIANINNQIHLIYIEEDGSFVLDSIDVGSWSTGLNEQKGKAVYNSANGIYTLTFEGDGHVAYGKIDGAVFMYCNKDGSEIETVSNRGGDGVTDVAISLRGGNCDYGYKDLAKNQNGDEMQRLYRELLDVYESFYGSNIDIVATDGKYILKKLNIEGYDISIAEMVSVWKIFGIENPAYYYFGNTLSVEGGALVLCIDPDYALASSRRKYEADIEMMKQECKAALDGKNTELLRVMAIHDYIVTKINYAYKSDGTTPEDAAWAHNIIGVSSKGQGVCEAYAKAFQYLCRVNGIESITVSGYGGEPHEWNLAKINGKWYGIDATWNDTGDNSKLSYDCFGLSFSNMIASHTHDMPTEYGVTYLYDIPTISNYDIQLVNLYENGNDLGLFCGIDDTFACMKNKDAEYVIKLYNYSDTGPLLLSSPMIKHYIYSAKTPDVKKISIEGTYKSFDGGYITMTPIYLVNTKGFTVTSDFSIRNMEFFNPDFIRFPGLILDNSTLTFTGNSCESEITKISRTKNDTTSTIVSDCDVSVYSDVNVHRIEGGPSFVNQQSHITLRGNVWVDEVELSIINLTAFAGMHNAKIGRFVGVGEYPTVGLEGYTAEIGDIVIEDVAENISFDIHFSNFDEVSDVNITGKSNGPIEICVDGQQSHLSTDADGNELESWIEKVDPFEVKKPFLRINPKIDIGSISVMFVEWTDDNGGYHVSKTALYEFDSDGYMVMGDFKKLADGSIIKGDTLIDYNGTEKTPTIPTGITRIAEGAFFNCSSITSVVLPEGITYVGSQAFGKCINMKKLTIPSTLVDFDCTIADFGNYEAETEIEYNGTAKEWRTLLMRIMAEGAVERLYVDTVKCTDGNGIISTPFVKDSMYPLYLFGSQWFEYENGENVGEMIYVFQCNEYGKAFLKYIYFNDDGTVGGAPLIQTGEDFDYTYSVEKQVFTVTIRETDYYLKNFGDEFAFCDAEGNVLDENPLASFLEQYNI